METTSTAPSVSAGPLRRIMSLIYDLLLLLGISFGYHIAVIVLRNLAGADTMEAPEGLTKFIIFSGLMLCFAAFFSWCWIKQGQTLGMKSWRMQLQQTDGGTITPKTCILRCLLAPLCISAGGIGFWWCWFDKNGDSLQDRLTNTRVLLLPKEKK